MDLTLANSQVDAFLQADTSCLATMEDILKDKLKFEKDITMLGVILHQLLYFTNPS